MITNYQFRPVISNFDRSQGLLSVMYGTLLTTGNVGLVCHHLAVHMFNNVFYCQRISQKAILGMSYNAYHRRQRNMTEKETPGEKKISVHFQPVRVIRINTFAPLLPVLQYRYSHLCGSKSRRMRV